MRSFVRVFFIGGVIAYRGLFNWIRPAMYIPTMLIGPLFQILFFAYLGRYSGLKDDAFFVVGNAIQASAMRWSRGADEVGYLTPADSIPGVSASVVAEDSKVSATVLGIGITYSSPGRLRPGGKGLPVDASWTYERVVGASGGIVPDRHAVRARLRVYFGIF